MGFTIPLVNIRKAVCWWWDVIWSATEEIHTWWRRGREKSQQRRLRKEAGRAGGRWDGRGGSKVSRGSELRGSSGWRGVWCFFFLPRPGSRRWQTAGLSNNTGMPTAPSAEEVKAGAETRKCNSCQGKWCADSWGCRVANLTWHSCNFELRFR